MMPPHVSLFENLSPHQNVLRRWIESVHQYPKNTAVLENEEQYTSYQTLHHQALQVAHYLIHHCPGNSVGLCLEKSTPYLSALLGCWLAKKTFVPLAPQLPELRRQFILEDAGIDFRITPEIYQKALELNLPPNFENSLDLDIPVDFPAYIIYTSGSTGTPKGVMVSHNGLVNLADCQRKGFQVDHTSRYLWYVSTQFDASLSDILVTLLSGATLIIETQNHPSGVSMTTHLLDWVKRLHITHLDIPPALLKQLDPEMKPPCLQTIVIGGEVCEKETVLRWAEKVNLVNVYGPTEATVCTSFCRCTSGWEVPLIGDPIAHTTYEIFDESLTPCAQGNPGELYIAGIGLALCYVNLETLTQEKFILHHGIRYYKTGDQVVRLPETSAYPGKIQFLGRLDRQVKIRGQLVALEEVEEALKGHPEILQAYVTKQPESTHHREALVAFIQWQGNNPNPSPILKEYLKNTLPPWMIPTHFHKIKTMPQTPSGKIDGNALLSQFMRIPEAPLTTQPLSSPQHQPALFIRDVFRRILKQPTLTVEDDFFAWGGDSMAVIELLLECQSHGLILSPKQLMEAPTPKAIAQSLFQETHPIESSKAVSKELHPLNQSSSSHINGHKMAASDLRKDIECLLPTKNPLPLSENHTHRHQPTPSPQEVFITGATGFLGSALVYQLLTQTSVSLHCLIRSQSISEGWERLKASLDKFGYSFPPGTVNLKERIKIVCGDIGKDQLGMPLEDYEALTKKIDTVYHCAATVNMVYPYETLKNINLLGVKRILDFCTQGKPKPLHYASTLSVFVATDHNHGLAKETDTLEAVQWVYGGYGQTKFAAEYYLLQIPQNHCDIFIYRFGLITGHSQTGISPSNDFLGKFVQGAHALEALPTDPSHTLAIDITPVDDAASAMCKISLSHTPHRIFHIANPTPLFYSVLLEYLLQSNMIQQIIPLEDWPSWIQQKSEALKPEGFNTLETMCLMGLCRLWEMLPTPANEYEKNRWLDLFQATQMSFDTQHTQTVVQQPCTTPDFSLIQKYIAVWKKQIQDESPLDNIPINPTHLMKRTRGLVLGKFLPPHQGHQFLIETALNHVHQLFIVVDPVGEEIIPVQQRIQWMEALYPSAIVITLPEVLPQSTEECPHQFWNLWESALKNALPAPPASIDLVFASEPYGEKLAEILGAQFHPVDIPRKQVPISATQIRENPWTHWDKIAPPARWYYLKKICIFGPESVGKSTLTENLAKHFNTSFIPEYARTFIEARNGVIHYPDMDIIAEKHHQAIQEGIQTAQGILWVDTDAITTEIWSKALFGKSSEGIQKWIALQSFDLYLLLKPDVPWIPDTVRYFPEDRDVFFQTCQNALDTYQRPYKIISGNWEERWQQALTEIAKILNPSN